MTARRSAASKSRRCTARVCMAVSNTRTPARPAVLAAYMAMSASRSSRSGSSSPPRASRTPTPALASTSRPDTVTGLRRMAAIRSPRATASPSSATSGTSTANSSPPSRAARSPGPRQPRSRSATTRRTSSPEEWPRLSLIVLKSSRSSRSRAGAAGPAPLEGAKRLLQPPGERRPVGSPVSGSTLARRATSAASSARPRAKVTWARRLSRASRASSGTSSESPASSAGASRPSRPAVASAATRWTAAASGAASRAAPAAASSRSGGCRRGAPRGVGSLSRCRRPPRGPPTRCRPL